MANYNNETNLDEYDDLDDFIVECDDGGNAVEDDDNGFDDDDDQDQEQPEFEEEEEEEEEEPPVGQQEILSLRERLKADLRRRNQANGAGAGTGTGSGKANSSSPVQEPIRAKFGNFFGPSRPALAPRLIEAGCSSIMRAIQDAPSRKGFGAPSVASKAQANASPHQQKPKIVSQEKRKVDLLRQNRDYTDLFSDDDDVPPATKEQLNSMPVMATKSDVEVCGPMQSAVQSKVPTNPPARILKDHGSIQSRVQSKAGSLRKDPLPNGKKTIAAARNGSSSLPSMKKAPSLQPSSNGKNLQRSMLIKRQQTAPPAGQRQQQLPKTQRPPQPSSQSPRPQKHRLPPQSSSQISRMNSSSVQSGNSAPKGSVQSLDRSRLAQKQLGPSLKAKQPQRNAVYDDHADKKRVVKRKCSEETKAILMIREMFHYNPQKYAGRDEDDSNMEADYRSIQMEERRSERLGKKEDEEQLRLLAEEEKFMRAKKMKR